MRRRVAALAATATALIVVSSASADYPHVSRHVPANPNTYYQANRPFGGIPIHSIMIHDTETSYAGTIEAFTNAKATSSVQYLVSGQYASSDPAITQFIPDRVWSHSVNNWWFNETSIGIEHVGFAVAPAGYYTPQLYQRSADLVGWIVWKYRLPLDRAHILGHDNIPNSEGVNRSTGARSAALGPRPLVGLPYYWQLILAAYARWSASRAAAAGGTPGPLHDPELEHPADLGRRRVRLGARRDRLDDGVQNGFTNCRRGRRAAGAGPARERRQQPLDIRPVRDDRRRPDVRPARLLVRQLPVVDHPQRDERDLAGPGGRPPGQGGLGRGVRAARPQAGRRRAVRQDRFSGTTGWVRDSDTTAGWGALLRFRGGSHPTTLFSGRSTRRATRRRPTP